MSKRDFTENSAWVYYHRQVISVNVRWCSHRLHAVVSSCPTLGYELRHLCVQGWFYWKLSLGLLGPANHYSKSTEVQYRAWCSLRCRKRKGLPFPLASAPTPLYSAVALLSAVAMAPEVVAIATLQPRRGWRMYLLRIGKVALCVVHPYLKLWQSSVVWLGVYTEAEQYLYCLWY